MLDDSDFSGQRRTVREDPMKESQTKLTKEVASKIIKKLETGKPADEEVFLFSVGRDDLFEYFDKKLQEIKDTGVSDVKFISADYGQGKTHFLDRIRLVALQHNFVVSKVGLHSRDVPFDKFEIVFQQIMKNLSTAEFRDDALEKLLNKWATKHPNGTANDLYRVLEDIPGLSPDLRKALVNYGLSYNSKAGRQYERCLNLLSWFQGDRINAAFRRDFRIMTDINATNVKEILHGFISFLKYMGYAGFIVMLDEAEAITSLTRLDKRDLANENIRKIVDNDKDTKGFYFVFASTPTFLSGDDDRGAQNYDALWRRIKNPLPVKGTSLHSVIVELPKLSQEEFYKLASRIKEIFEVASGKQITNITATQLNLLASYVHQRTDQRVGTLVRSTVFVLNESMDPDFDFARKYQIVVDDVLSREEKERAEA